MEANYQLVAYYRILKNWTGELGQFFTPSKGHYVCLSYLLQVEGMCSNKLGCVLTHTHAHTRTHAFAHKHIHAFAHTGTHIISVRQFHQHFTRAFFVQKSFL